MVEPSLPPDGRYIALARDHSICLVWVKTGAIEANRLAVRAGYFDGLQLIGPDLRCWDVAERSIVRPRSAGEWLARLVGRVRIRVTAVAGQPEEIGATSARTIAQVLRDPEFWESGGDLADLIERIRSAKTFSDIVQALGLA